MPTCCTASLRFRGPFSCECRPLLPGARRPSRTAAVAELLGARLASPACSVDEPGAVYVGRVNKLESGRNVPSVEVQFFDDGSKYW